MRLGVILLSGGLDSSTAAALALRQGFDLLALTVDYGQRHRREIEAAAEVARRLRLRHRTLFFPDYKELARHSALTDAAAHALPLDRPIDEMGRDVPITYVPLRNTFLLTLAAAALESEVLGRLEAGARPSDLEAAVFIAANVLDYSGYPDCRPEYFERMEAALAAGSRIGSAHGIRISIRAPLLKMGKAEIVREAVALEVPLEATWSCYEGADVPCGRCDACRLRRKGFEEAGIPDPARTPLPDRKGLPRNNLYI